jgi:hypothetical protein
MLNVYAEHIQRHKHNLNVHAEHIQRHKHPSSMIVPKTGQRHNHPD